jgi:hypothetical protein
MLRKQACLSSVMCDLNASLIRPFTTCLKPSGQRYVTRHFIYFYFIASMSCCFSLQFKKTLSIIIFEDVELFCWGTNQSLLKIQDWAHCGVPVFVLRN